MLIDKDTRVIVYGITGKQGRFHTKKMLEYGTKIVAGVTPGKGGGKVEGIPVYDNAKEALKEHEAEYAVLFVPASSAKTAAFEALESLNLVIITEGIPVNDMIEIMQKAKAKKRVVIGGNCPGICKIGESKIGIMPNDIFTKGDIGIVSRSGTLTYEIVSQLSSAGLGQHTCIGIGGDMIIGTGFNKILKNFQKDDEIKRIVLIGEIGGDLEEKAAVYIKENITKPVVAYIAGRTAPPGKTMGHAGAITGESGEESAENKIKILEKNRIRVAKLISEMPKIISMWKAPAGQ